MPTLCGLRRRGYTPESIRNFAELIGVAKKESTVDVTLLEYCIREDLNKNAPRKMAVLHPLKVVITNYPEGQVEELDAVNNPEDASMGSRKVPFSKVLYIERDDFMENPPKKFFRLAPGKEVRLRYAYYITCQNIIKNESTGEILELHCTYDPATRGGSSPDGRKVQGTIHWVSAEHAVKAEVRLYDHLFSKENPSDLPENEDYTFNLNPNSLETIKGYVEPSLKSAKSGECFQFERIGYFNVDYDSTLDNLAFNRTVTLKDSWAKIQKSEVK